jgi:MFS family permease
MEVQGAGLFFGMAMMVGGMGGALLGGTFADRRRRLRFAGELDVPIFAAALSVPLAIGLLALPWPPLFMTVGLLTPMAIFACFPAIQTVVVELVPPRQHGIAYAVNILFLGGVGTAVGPLVVGWVSDLTQSLTWAMITPAGGMALASLVMAAAARIIRQDHARRAVPGVRE